MPGEDRVGTRYCKERERDVSRARQRVAERGGWMVQGKSVCVREREREELGPDWRGTPVKEERCGTRYCKEKEGDVERERGRERER